MMTWTFVSAARLAPHSAGWPEQRQLRQLYDLGEDISLCWATDPALGTTHREDCAGSFAEFTFEWPSVMTSDTTYHVTYNVHVPPGLSPGNVTHTNIHSCLRNGNVFCTPFVSATSSLATCGQRESSPP